jgi:hypothetical protein
MDLFISWSGQMSRDLGEALRAWLPMVLQGVRPFFAPDIEKGARWSRQIAEQLDACKAGIFCMTKENLAKPWIMFEAGALSRNGGRVCPLLFDVDAADLEGPMGQFQAAPFCEDEMRQMIRTLNSALGPDRLDEQVVERTFEMWWPDLHARVRRIRNRHEPQPSGEKPEQSDRDLIEEILNLAKCNLPAREVRPPQRHPAGAGLFLVTCALETAGENHRRIEQYLTNFPYWRLVEDAWLVRSSENAGGMRDRLRQLVGPNDVVFVAQLDGSWASLNFQGADWLNAGHPGAVPTGVRPACSQL